MKLRIFVIDDEECIRDTFRWHLEDLGHEVVTAEEPMLCDVYQGHNCKEEQPCADVLLIDYYMPNMTGLEFIELMSKRGCKGHPANRIIVSGDTSAIDMEKVKQLGCQVEQKPVSYQRLDELIAQAEQRLPPNRKLADLSAKKDKEQS